MHDIVLTEVVNYSALQFEDYAGDVAIIANSNADKISGVAKAMSTAATSQALLMANLTSNAWPNVTLPDFDRRYLDANNLTGVAFFMFAMHVTDKNLPEYQAYMHENQGWLAQDWSHRDPTYDAGPIAPVVYAVGPEGTIVPSPYTDYYPLWQIGPLPYAGNMIGLDLYPFPDFKVKFDDGVQAKHTLLSGILEITELLTYLATDNDGKEPHSGIFEPVFSDFTDGAEVMGFVIAGLPWKFTLADILPTGE